MQGQMLVFVRVPGNALLELTLPATITVGTVKDKLSKLTPFPAWKQDLWLQNTNLEDERTLAECGVETESTLRLSQRFDPRRDAEMEQRMPIITHVCSALMLPEDFAVELYMSGFSCDTCIPLLYGLSFRCSCYFAALHLPFNSPTVAGKSNIWKNCLCHSAKLYLSLLSRWLFTI
jgi:hypothetical protein